MRAGRVWRGREWRQVVGWGDLVFQLARVPPCLRRHKDDSARGVGSRGQREQDGLALVLLAGLQPDKLLLEPVGHAVQGVDADLGGEG